MHQKLEESEERVGILEADNLAGVPLDVADEIKKLKVKVMEIQKDKDEQMLNKAATEASNIELQAKVKSLEKNEESQQTSTAGYEVLYRHFFIYIQNYRT